MISAKIIADSKNEFGNRITTMIVTFPRIILAEFNTHRMFSRNSASSRAIPFEKMLQSVSNNPFVPIAIQKDHKGMQGIEYLEDIELDNALSNWSKNCDNAIKGAKVLSENNTTKQLCNRLLEPFMYHTVIVTATEWENFFALRCPKYGHKDGPDFRSKKDVINFLNKENNMQFEQSSWTDLQWLQSNKGQAEIHMMALAEAMWDAYNESSPKLLKAGEWHIPFENKIDYSKFIELIDLESTQNKTPQEVAVMISTVMNARVSYTTIETEQSEWTYDKYIKKHDELLSANPKHMSPFEHCARCMSKDEYTENGLSTMINNDGRGYFEEGVSGNFRGFIQYRKTFNNENITK